MEDTPAVVTVEAANTANDLAAPRFGATSVLATMALEEVIPVFLAAGLDLTALDAPAVAASATARDSIARLRTAVFIYISCLMQ
jgi:hypothetical protein